MITEISTRWTTPEPLALIIQEPHAILPPEAGKTTWVECFSGKGAGTGGVSFSTAEEAANAITMLNGTRRVWRCRGWRSFVPGLGRILTRRKARLGRV